MAHNFNARMRFNLLLAHLPAACPAGTLYYAVAYDRLYASYGAQQLAFGQLTPTAAAVMGASPTAFLGGLVANGSVAVTTAGQWTTVRVQPPCVAALCGQSLWGLQGGTPYRVYLVAADSFGNVDPAPAVVTVTTAPATSAPALLPATQPANVTDSGFGVAVSQDAAGSVYYLLVTAKAGVSTSGADVAPGSWSQVGSLVPSAGSRRRLTGNAVATLPPSVLTGVETSSSGQPQHGLRQLLQDAISAVQPGTLVDPICYPTNRTCKLAPADAFSGTAGLAGNFDVVASGCVPMSAAGLLLAVPPFAGLQNNTLYHLLLASEDLGVPQPHHLAPPVMFAVRTVDLSAPKLACGFPAITNITSTSLALSAMLTKPGASVFFVVLPAAATPAPTALEVLRGTAAGGGSALAAGNLTQSGWLPWEAAPAAGAAGDPRKRWAAVGGLQSGGNYTAYFTVSADGSVPVPGAPLAVLRWVASRHSLLANCHVWVGLHSGVWSVLFATFPVPAPCFHSRLPAPTCPCCAAASSPPPPCHPPSPACAG